MIEKSSLYHKYTKILPLDDSFVRDPLLSASALTETELSVLNILFSLSSSYTKVYVSQTKIGTWLNLTRRQINRVISKLNSLGLIAKIHRTYDTCIYLIADIFRQPRIKDLLKQLLPNIIKLSFSIGQLLFPSLKRKIKKMKCKKNFNAEYHRPWDGNSKKEEPTRPGGFRSIGEVMDSRLKHKPCELEEVLSEAKATREPDNNMLKPMEEDCLSKLSDMAERIPQDKFDMLLKSGRTLKERVTMCERYLLKEKFKEQLKME